MRLVPFDPAHANLVLSWARTPAELDAWASLGTAPGPGIFTTWLSDPDVHGRLLVADAPVAYGELWVSRAEDEVELAHLLVAPERRNRGVGRTLVEHLAAEAGRIPVSSVWVRVVPENTAAIRCYRGAGFEPVTPARESELNAPQPREYRWLRRRP